jgi:hypothetical protein
MREPEQEPIERNKPTAKLQDYKVYEPFNEGIQFSPKASFVDLQHETEPEMDHNQEYEPEPAQAHREQLRSPQQHQYRGYPQNKPNYGSGHSKPGDGHLFSFNYMSKQSRERQEELDYLSREHEQYDPAYETEQMEFHEEVGQEQVDLNQSEMELRHRQTLRDKEIKYLEEEKRRREKNKRRLTTGSMIHLNQSKRSEDKRLSMNPELGVKDEKYRDALPHKNFNVKAVSRHNSQGSLADKDSNYDTQKKSAHYGPDSEIQEEVPLQLSQFLHYFTKIITQEHILEQVKINLATKQDFSIFNIFNSIEKTSPNSFDFEEFRGFLIKIGVPVNDARSLIDLYSSFDKKQVCYLGLEELEDMLLPEHPQFREMGRKPVERLMSMETIQNLADIFNELFKMRRVILEAKKSVKNNAIDLGYIFEFFDKEERGAVGVEGILELGDWAGEKTGKELEAEAVELFVKRINYAKGGKEVVQFKDFYIFFSL